MADKIKVNIYMPPELLEALKRLAAATDQPYAEVVRAACRAYVSAQAEVILGQRKTLQKIASYE